MKIIKARKYTPEPTYKVELELTQTELKVLEHFITDKHDFQRTDIWFIVQELTEAVKKS